MGGVQPPHSLGNSMPAICWHASNSLNPLTLSSQAIRSPHRKPEACVTRTLAVHDGEPQRHWAPSHSGHGMLRNLPNPQKRHISLPPALQPRPPLEQVSGA